MGEYDMDDLLIFVGLGFIALGAAVLTLVAFILFGFITGIAAVGGLLILAGLFCLAAGKDC